MPNQTQLKMAIRIRVISVSFKRLALAPIMKYDKDSDGRPDNICQGCSQPKHICICGVYCSGCGMVSSKCKCN